MTFVQLGTNDEKNENPDSCAKAGLGKQWQINYMRSVSRGRMIEIKIVYDMSQHMLIAFQKAI